jgi:hypothetical protein
MAAGGKPDGGGNKNTPTTRPTTRHGSKNSPHLPPTRRRAEDCPLTQGVAVASHREQWCPGTRERRLGARASVALRRATGVTEVACCWGRWRGALARS